jgi:hypothetical protein
MASRGLDPVAWRALAIATVIVAVALAATRFLTLEGVIFMVACGAFLLIGMGLADAWRVSRPKNRHRHDQPDT